MTNTVTTPHSETLCASALAAGPGAPARMLLAAGVSPFDIDDQALVATVAPVAPTDDHASAVWEWAVVAPVYEARAAALRSEHPGAASPSDWRLLANTLRGARSSTAFRLGWGSL